MTGIRELMDEARRNPPKPIIRGLLNESEIAGLHGPPEAFKTILSLQAAEAIAKGEDFLVFSVPKPRPVYFLETEMSVPALGDRVSKMYKNRPIPNGVHFASEAQLRQFRKAAGLQEKFDLLNSWVRDTKAEVLILDTANPFFRRKESPNEETTAGLFFDLLEACPAKTKLFVRHNRKRRAEDTEDDGAGAIRGSGQFGDVPDLLMEMRRADKRVDKTIFNITKFRHGSKPPELELWFDRGEFRLIVIPPPIHLLLTKPLSRGELIAALQARFGIAQRLGDEMIDKEREFLVEQQDGHKRVFRLDWDEAKQADWSRHVKNLGETVGDMQDCISPSLRQGERQPSRLYLPRA